MKCPFRKKMIYHNVLYGQGYPAPDMVEEIFEDCIREDCTAFSKYNYTETYPDPEMGFKFRKRQIYKEECTLLNNTISFEKKDV